MKRVVLLLGVFLVGIGAALTYHVFENIVHSGIDLIWYDWFDTDNNRYMVIPLAVILSLVFFASVHFLDRKSEKHQEEGLGNVPDPTVKNYLKILLIGFFSLVAGASLGPEAVLVPACMVLGAMVGLKLSKDQKVEKLLAAAGLMALFTAFFHSFFVGVLSVLLVSKQAKTKISPILFVTAIVSSLAAYLTLSLLDGKSYLHLPEYGWQLDVDTVLVCIGLVVAGYITIWVMGHINVFSEKIHVMAQKKSWVVNALVASLVISALYLIGGPLVEFTGNRSISPMFSEAGTLGLAGLLGILVVKTVVIAWSKAMGYRGGMIFPTIFLAAVLVAIVQLYIQEFNMIYGLIAVLVGAFVANSKNDILV